MPTSERLKKTVEVTAQSRRISHGRLRRAHPGAAITRPFAPAIIATSRRLAARYQIVLTSEEGHWYGHGLELPTVFGDGETPEAAIADTREALVTTVAYMLEHRRRPPAPVGVDRRSTQVKVRLTLEEKRMLKSRAKVGGFRGLSDFIRTSVLSNMV